jgi:hypothetical protein
VQREQLLTESQVFEEKVFPGTKSADHPAEEMPERHHHGKNLIQIVRIELFAKSFILWMYDVLARHNGICHSSGAVCFSYQRIIIEVASTLSMRSAVFLL